MRSIQRQPAPALRPFVRTIWVADAPAGATARERVLPTGLMHLVVRLSDAPLRTFAHDGDTTGTTYDCAVVGGVRDSAYIRGTADATVCIGAMLEPGAAEVLLGVPADELAGQHFSLEDLWGRDARRMRDRLAETLSAEARLSLFESMLLARLPKVRAIHPAVAHALSRIHSAGSVSELVADTGYSHRRFIELFRRSVGIAPAVFRRLLRFQRAVALLAPGRAPDGDGADQLAQVAFDSGFSDQSHMTREFREIAGLSPGQYRAIAPANPHHVPMVDVLRAARLPETIAAPPDADTEGQKRSRRIARRRLR